jgi:hypothetical protein
MTDSRGASAAWINSVTIHELETTGRVRTVVSPAVIDLLGDIDTTEKFLLDLRNQRSHRAVRWS